MSQNMLSITEIWQYLKNLRVNIQVKRTFPAQVKQVDTLLENDKTGIVSTIYDFMVHSATVPMKIETKNESLNKFLQIWQKQLLNRDVNIDIPGGLRALSVENYKERWRSSLLALKVIWGEEDFGGSNGKWIVPKKMWFLNGGAIETESSGSLNTRKFYVKTGKGKDDKTQLTSSPTQSVFIRKPFTSWHKDEVTPYLTQRGTIFNALMKSAIVQKQSDVIEAILPLILQLKAGNDKLALEGMNPSEEDFKELKEKIVNAKERFDQNGEFGDLIASLRHDVNLDYLIPDLTKILDDKIVKSTDRNLLASLGLIELQGFSSTRQEAILNPKVLIEEVTDAVLDWASLLEDVMIDMLNRNKAKHSTLTNSEIRIIPGKIKAFVTDDMKALLRSMYDRGILSKQTGAEDIADVDFEVEVERREKEAKRDLQTTMKPPVIQNLEQYQDPDVDNLEDQNKKPGTPEGDNFNNAILKNYPKKGAVTGEQVEVMAPYETIDALPDDVKDVLPVSAQLIWLTVFNAILKESGDKEQACKGAWTKAKDKYEKVAESDKWVKKATIETYKEKMSNTTYKFFEEIYTVALDQCNSTKNALETALAITEKVSTRNKNGILVKNKTITKAQLNLLDNSNIVDEILNLELKEKKLALLDKLLKSEE